MWEANSALEIILRFKKIKIKSHHVTEKLDFCVWRQEESDCVRAPLFFLWEVVKESPWPALWHEMQINYLVADVFCTPATETQHRARFSQMPPQNTAAAPHSEKTSRSRRREVYWCLAEKSRRSKTDIQKRSPLALVRNKKKCTIPRGNLWLLGFNRALFHGTRTTHITQTVAICIRENVFYRPHISQMDKQTAHDFTICRL